MSTIFVIQILSFIDQSFGQQGGEVFWELHDDMENWTSRQWDEWWKEMELKFGTQDEEFPEWNQQHRQSNKVETSEPPSAMERTGHLRGYKNSSDPRAKDKTNKGE